MARIVGTQENDTLIGTPDGDLIQASGGNDLVQGVGGSDTLDGGLGGDTLHGGQGFDFLEYVNSAAVIVNLETNAAAGGHAFGDVFSSIEGILGSTQNDILTGNARDNKIVGRPGNDLIRGGDGRDELAGSEGNDTIDGGNGEDTIRGGPGADDLDAGTTGGFDVLSFEFATSGVTADLATGRGTRGEALGDRYRGFEDIIGSRHADVLLGNDGDNFIRSSGSDTMQGRGGDDQLIGSGVLSGGEGNDALFGSGTLNGNQGNDLLAGTDGAETLNGGLGDDILSAVRGADVLRGGGGADKFTFIVGDESTVALGQDRILDFVQGEDKLDLSTIDANPANAGVNDAFVFIGRDAFTGTVGELRFFISLANNATFVQSDDDGDGVVDLQFILEGQIALTAGDFVL